jgi:hypothetical protein
LLVLTISRGIIALPLVGYWMIYEPCTARSVATQHSMPHENSLEGPRCSNDMSPRAVALGRVAKKNIERLDTHRDCGLGVSHPLIERHGAQVPEMCSQKGVAETKRKRTRISSEWGEDLVLIQQSALRPRKLGTNALACRVRDKTERCLAQRWMNGFSSFL